MKLFSSPLFFRSWLSETCINHNKQRDEFLISSFPACVFSPGFLWGGEGGCDVPGIGKLIWQRLLREGYSLRHACLGCLVLGMICWTGSTLLSGEEPGPAGACRTARVRQSCSCDVAVNKANRSNVLMHGAGANRKTISRDSEQK